MKKETSKQRKYQIRMKEEGRCVRCGRNRNGKSVTHCDECLEKRREEYRRRKRKKVEKRLRKWEELGEVKKFVEGVIGEGEAIGMETLYGDVDVVWIRRKNGEFINYELEELLKKREDLIDLVYEII